MKKGRLATITGKKSFKMVAGAAIVIGGITILKKLFRREDEIIGEGEWADDDEDEDEEDETDNAAEDGE